MHWSSKNEVLQSIQLQIIPIIHPADGALAGLADANWLFVLAQAPLSAFYMFSISNALTKNYFDSLSRKFTVSFSIVPPAAFSSRLRLEQITLPLKRL